MPQLDDPMAHLTLNNRPDTTISRLEALPQELRQEILRYILRTEYARLSNPERTTANRCISRLKSYDWNINVLRVCRTLYADGFEILNKENKWIKLIISMHARGLLQSLLNYDVHFIKQAGAAILDNNLANILISSERTPRQHRHSEVILLPLEEMEKFCWFLRAMDMCYLGLKFKFEFPNKLPQALQRRILEPFAHIEGEADIQKVAFTGQVHKAIEARVSKAMTQPVGWLRMKVWDIYDTAINLKAIADQAWLAGDYAIACHKYGQTNSFWDEVRPTEERSKDPSLISHSPQALEAHDFPEEFDRVFSMAKSHLFTVCAIGQVAAGIRAGEVSDEWIPGDISVLDRFLQERPFVPDHLLALHAFAISLAALYRRKPRVAAAGFQLALGYATIEQKVSSAIAMAESDLY